MKIADKITMTALAVVLGFGLGAFPAHAQVVDLSTTSKTVSETADEALNQQDTIDDEAAFGEGSPVVPDSVKGVVKRLNDATKDVTLEDLNSAREAVVKLDVLIDIEKRLNDLISLRKEREEQEMGLAAAIPESALGAPQMAGSSAMSAPVSIPAPSSPEIEDITVVRITGTSGRYMAMIEDSDGSESNVRVGDTLADGSKVRGISRYGVTLNQGKKRRTIQIKDVGTVLTGR